MGPKDWVYDGIDLVEFDHDLTSFWVSGMMVSKGNHPQMAVLHLF